MYYMNINKDNWTKLWIKVRGFVSVDESDSLYRARPNSKSNDIVFC
jgi:hypothetical protein